MYLDHHCMEAMQLVSTNSAPRVIFTLPTALAGLSPSPQAESATLYITTLASTHLSYLTTCYCLKLKKE